MSNLQQFPAVAGDIERYLTSQVNIFLFDLKNEASEHGFKRSGSWTLQLVTEEEMIDLKRQHHPVISLSLQPHTLLQVFQAVKTKLQQSLNENETELTASDLTKAGKRHMAAYYIKSSRK